MATKKLFTLECPPLCTLGPASAVGVKVTELLLEGRLYRDIIEIVLREDGYKLWPGTISRHKRHVVVTGITTVDEPTTRYKAGNIEILESIIQKGFQNQKNWKPTISDTMKAMDMWFRLTQGNPFDDLLNTLAKASIEEDDDEPPEREDPKAAMTIDEAVMADSVEDDLEAFAEKMGVR